MTRFILFLTLFLTGLLSTNVSAQIETDGLLDRIARRVEIRGDRTFDILVLSGGGEYGAYGTGFLRGWKSRPADPMPNFDMVTGISTGALIAPYAFPGDAASLDEISAEYSEHATDAKPTFEYLFFLKRDGSLLSRKNLQKAVERKYGEALVSRLQPGFEEGRILLMGTTNLRSGIGTIWSVEDELKRNNDGAAFFQKILLASTAIPGAFAPVELNGEPHADGGVVSNTLLGLDLADFRTLAQRLPQIAEPVRVRLWVIVNGPVYPMVETGDYRNVLAVEVRAERLLLGLKEPMTLTRYWELAEAVNAGVPGLKVEVRYTALPQDMGAKVTLKKIFDPLLMKKLDQFGYERALSDSPWDALPLSPYRRP